MKNYKVLLPSTPSTHIVTVKADRFSIEHGGTLVFYEGSTFSSEEIYWQPVRAFNSQQWVEVLLEENP